jgi:ribosome-binding protein aMBF1 (putative translation factor)
MLQVTTVNIAVTYRAMLNHAETGLNREDSRVTPAELDDLVAANVRAARARRNLRQEDLADELGWDRAIISRIEAGRRRIQLADAIALCEVLEIGFHQLLEGLPVDTFRKLGLERRG